jgi:hypothetical protein
MNNSAVLTQAADETGLIIEMDDFEKIRGALSDCETVLSADPGTSEIKSEFTKSITITNSNLIVHLQNQIIEIKAENMDHQRRAMDSHSLLHK